MKQFEQYGDMVARLYPQPKREDGRRVLSQTVTFQVTDDCNLACTYCYQIHKGKRRMSFEVAKKFADLLISGEKGFSEYINPEISPAIIIDFIGGEPFLEIELIDQICDYIMAQLIEKNHPWAMNAMFSICSNGVLYDDPRVQKFLHKWRNRLSFSVTIDGNKELHDSCRVFPDGKPSYDLAVHAAKDWMKQGFYMGSKITIAPENVVYLFDAIKHMVELGYEEINANCVYEEGWKPMHATILYDQMKKIGDYFLDLNLDFEHNFYCSLYNEKFFHPKEEDDLQNWCFRAGTKVLTPDGEVNIEELRIGDKVISGSGNVQVVEKNMSRYTDDTIMIYPYGVEPIYTTNEHPFLCKVYDKETDKFSEAQWVKAADIKESDLVAQYISHSENGIITDNDNKESILSMKFIPVHLINKNCDGYDVYNLTVSNDHTFIANGIIVHNCGGNGVMLSCDPDGILFPCLRYMESSLGDDQVPYSIGDVDVGLCQTECDKCRVDCLRKIDRRTQSTDECFYCPIAEGCSWCTAYNYQVFGTPDARATYICIMHKARALGNLYFWNKYYRKHNMDKRMENNVPDEWALEIITEEELDMLKELCK